jgi:tetratricopeptide (TPR) repeat protein
MARAAVKAKQQAKAKAAPPKARTRGRRKHASGGNPNQQLFFMRLRRGQRWLYALLAVVFAATFAGVGVGSGSGGLSQLYSGLFGAGGNPVSKAKNEIKKHPAKGYRDLATAYETKGQMTQATNALQSYLAIKKKDGNAWAELGGLELSQAQTAVTQYQAAQQEAQIADPSAPFSPGGTLAQAVGANAAYSAASQQATAQTSTLYQQATTALNAAVTDYQKAAKVQPRNPTAQEQLATAAENAGNTPVAIKAWKRYLALYPNAPQKKQIEARIKALGKGGATVKSSGSTKSKSGKK